MEEEEIKNAWAIVSSLPSFSGDGYEYGGGVVLTIGDRTIQFGEGWIAQQLAREVADRWNYVKGRKP